MLLSIIVPVYNAEKYLCKCIESVLNQTYQNFELLLIDDGSTDRSMQICQEYMQKDKRIVCYEGVHKGPYFARKFGVEKASGTYITFLDADDFVAQESYRMALGDMKRQIDVVVFDISRYFDDAHIRYDRCVFSEKVYCRDEMLNEIFPILLWDEKRETWGIDPALCNKIFRATLIKKYFAMPWNIWFHYGEDVALVYPIIVNAFSLSVRHQSYYFHRQREKNKTAPYFEDEGYVKGLYALYGHLQNVLKEYPVFGRQIDLFFAYSAQFIRTKYGLSGYADKEQALFPFDRVERGDRVVLYGAGNVGKQYRKQMDRLCFCRCVLWVDTNYQWLGEQIHAPSEICQIEYDKVVIAVADLQVKEQIKANLIRLGVAKDLIL